MGIPSSRILLLLFPIAVLLSTASAENSADTTFLYCLVNNSEPSHPIAETIFTPNSSSFSSLLQAYIRNLRFNTSTTRKPFLIVTASHISHVQASIVCGKRHNLLVKIRSGGHDYEGVSYVAAEPFFILDMFNFRSIEIDMDTETAWVGAGATLGEVYYRIAEKSKFHGFPAGAGPTVGVGGHISGAGYGNLMRKYGTSGDNIVDAQIVDVQGRLLNRSSMGEDLFWAIRGGGGGSFGVVLAYKIKLVQVPEGVAVFQVERTLEQNATDIVYNWQHVAPTISNDLFIRLILEVVNGTQIATKTKQPELGVPEETNSSQRDEPIFESQEYFQRDCLRRRITKTVRATFIALFLGDSETLVSLTKERFPQLGLEQSDCIETSWLRSVLFWDNIDMTTPVEILLERQPQSLKYLKRKSDYVKRPISKEGWEGIWKKMIELEKAVMYFNPYGGRMAEIPSTEIAFPHRDGNLWMIQYKADWYEAGEEIAEYNINLVRELHKYMTPFVSQNPRQAFMCYKDLDLGINHQSVYGYFEGSVYGVQYFDDNFNRLVQIKTRVDPDSSNEA